VWTELDTAGLHQAAGVWEDICQRFSSAATPTAGVVVVLDFQGPGTPNARLVVSSETTTNYSEEITGVDI
jgi:hypothetical protein